MHTAATASSARGGVFACGGRGGGGAWIYQRTVCYVLCTHYNLEVNVERADLRKARGDADRGDAVELGRQLAVLAEPSHDLVFRAGSDLRKEERGKKSGALATMIIFTYLEKGGGWGGEGGKGQQKGVDGRVRAICAYMHMFCSVWALWQKQQNRTCVALVCVLALNVACRL